MATSNANPISTILTDVTPRRPIPPTRLTRGSHPPGISHFFRSQECLRDVQRPDRIVQLLRQWRSGVAVRHDLNIRPRAAGFGLLDSRVELTAGGDPGGKPAVAAHRLRQLMIVPFREIVVVDLGVLAEQPLYQIAVVVEQKDDRLQTEAMELGDLLGGELVRALAGDQYGAPLRCGQCGAERGGRGPPDRAPQRLIVEDRTLGHLSEPNAHRGRSGFRDQDVARLEHLLPPGIEILRGDLVVRTTDRLTEPVTLWPLHLLF